MRVAATPNFKKLWGRVDTDIQVGVYNLHIENNFSTTQFGGRF